MRLPALFFAVGLSGLLGASGCVKSCQDGSVFLTIQLEDRAAAADTIRVEVKVEGGQSLTGTYPFADLSRKATVQIEFADGYPQGKAVTFRAVALGGSQTLAAARTTQTLADACAGISLRVGGDQSEVCDPAQSGRCSDDFKDFLACNADGTAFVTQSCRFGCNSFGGAHCRQIEPAGATTAADVNAGTTKLDLTSDTTFDTDTGAIAGGFTRGAGEGVQNGVTYRVIGQPGSNVKVGVFSLRGFTIPEGVVVRAYGKNPLVLLSSDDVDVRGILDLTGDCVQAAAGAGVGGQTAINAGTGGGPRGGSGGATQGGIVSGGGGGGYGDIGGGGGGSSGGAGGGVFGDLSLDNVILLGGAGGGAGGAMGGVGGHGGGAVQIAVGGNFSLSGTIAAGGCGGAAGPAQAGGGGGGSGGSIVIEALAVVLKPTGALWSNGGGGGGGDGGQPGGRAGGTGSVPGGAGGSLGTMGGTGGATTATAGANGGGIINASTKYGGGGGGGVGRIAIKTMSGMPDDQGAGITPAAADRNNSAEAMYTVGHITLQ